ncbi:MAG: RND superfamily efflux pump MFP component [Nitrospirales bacterium]|nr:MAG: RND superfamily efflux pump MFP component [Nitrospirales bacterium]
MTRILLPIGVLSMGLLTAFLLLTNRSQPEAESLQPEPPRVEVIEVQPQSVRVTVTSQGVAMPRTEIDLVTEVAGKVIHVHPAFAAGGSFHRGDVLVAVDPRDYQLARIEAQSRLAEAQRLLAQEEAQVEQALKEWQVLGKGEATALALRTPQLREIRAKVAAAKADGAKAKLQQIRCVLRAPFNGRIRAKHVDVGQYIVPGEKVARLYATDSLEVRLPVSMEQLAFLDIPWISEKNGSTHTAPSVTLHTTIGGIMGRWVGYIIRTEGALEPSSGQLSLVARVSQPKSDQNHGRPLLPGTFLQAEIEGREYHQVFVIPPAVLNTRTEQVLVVDDTNRLKIQQLEVLKSETDRLVVREGLQAGDQVVVSGIDVPIEGMEVTISPPSPIVAPIP